MGAYLGVRLGAWANYQLGFLRGPPLEMPYPILWPAINQGRGSNDLQGGPSGEILGDKMNLAVRLDKLFYESSLGVPALFPTA